MSARLKVEMIPKPAHRSAFLKVIADPRTTVDIAHLWMVAKGYRIGRSAVWNYRSIFRRRFGALDFNCDAEARRKARACLKELSGPDLFAVALFACCIVNARAQKGSVRRSI